MSVRRRRIKVCHRAWRGELIQDGIRDRLQEPLSRVSFEGVKWRGFALRIVGACECDEVIGTSPPTGEVWRRV